MSARVCSQIYIELSGVSLTPTWDVPQSATVGHHRRGWGHADGVGDVPFGTVLSRSQHDPEISTARGYGSLKQKPSFNCVISSLPDSVAADVDDLLEPLAGAPTKC
ncbi:hypothetical protein T05_15930 [Trichinella murrelli]|uniref:Uncharacterized protein n=1 Tax=Trichinella murrelli TaxID=144512 RepID=A0A0V0UCC9_9BILA|nr:hypothetical protein T05_15930 [Trichinella murrelli]